MSRRTHCVTHCLTRRCQWTKTVHCLGRCHWIYWLYWLITNNWILCSSDPTPASFKNSLKALQWQSVTVWLQRNLCQFSNEALLNFCTFMTIFPKYSNRWVSSRVIYLKQQWGAYNPSTGPRSSPAIPLFACKPNPAGMWWPIKSTKFPSGSLTACCRRPNTCCRRPSLGWRRPASCCWR